MFGLHLGKRGRTGEPQVRRYVHPGIGTAVEGIVAVKENLALYVGRQAPVYREVSSVLDGVIATLAKADHYAQIEAKIPQPVIPSILRSLLVGNRLTWFFGATTILFGILGVTS